MLGAIARGGSTAEIAAELFLSPHTVRDYVKTVFEKFGVSSRGELVARLFGEHYADRLHDTMVHVELTSAVGLDRGPRRAETRYRLRRTSREKLVRVLEPADAIVAARVGGPPVWNTCTAAVQQAIHVLRNVLGT